METLWGVWCGGEALVGAGRARFSRTHDGSFGIIMTGVVSRPIMSLQRFCAPTEMHVWANGIHLGIVTGLLGRGSLVMAPE